MVSQTGQTRDTFLENYPDPQQNGDISDVRPELAGQESQ